MRLKQYIINEEKTYSFEEKTYSFEEIITLIMDKCQPVIKELLPFGYNDNFLMSGRKHKNEVFIGKVRKNRKPTDTPLEIHNLFDSMFKKRYGWKPRSNAIFCTGSIDQANDYGQPYLIFPMGKIKYIYNPNIKDLFSDVLDNGIYSIEPDDPDVIEDINVSMVADMVREIGEELYYNKYEGDPDTDPDIEDWMDDHYDEIKDDVLNKMAEENKEHNLEIYDEVISGYKTNNLKRALGLGIEIMVGCKEYMALDFYLYYDLIEYYLHTYGDKKPTREILEEVDESVHYDKKVKFWKD